MELHCLVPAIIIAFLVAKSAAYCGVSNLQPPYGRIVGGEKAQHCSEIPWQVKLDIGSREKGYFRCGGSIIGPHHILTAAHCTVGWGPENIEVTVGGIKQFDGSKYRVHGIIEHGSYNKDSHVHDIAVLRLEDDLSFNECVQPICRSSSFSLNGQKCLVSGFGLTRFGKDAPLSPDLLKVWVKTHRGPNCNAAFNIQEWYYVEDKNRMVCAADDNKDSCSGDSGGPLVCQGSDKKYYQVGVVSYGHDCAVKGFPGVYTDAQYYHSWIDYVLRTY